MSETMNRYDAFVSVVVPVHNIGPMVEPLINGLHQVMTRWFQHFEIVLVDNASGDNTVAEIRRLRPDAVVTIDSSGFSWRVAHGLRRRGERLPLIHYVAPMGWAWPRTTANSEHCPPVRATRRFTAMMRPARTGASRWTCAGRMTAVPTHICARPAS